MIPKRDEEGWREFGPWTWKIEREDHYGDRSTTTRLTLTWVARWTLRVGVTRSWVEEEKP
jgi:hypothetical protein